MPQRASAFAPGRVNLIGEHTDYNGGLALAFAIAEGVSVEATANGGRRIEATALDYNESDAFDMDDASRDPGWRGFVRGAVGELLKAGFPLHGTRLRIHGNVPPGAGLSSSAALEVALTLALIRLSGARPPERMDLAKLCSRIENDWVGARTGLLDQISSLYGERDRALRIDFGVLQVDHVPLDLGVHQLVILDSGEQHANASSGYNQRREECARACDALGVASLSEASLEQAERLPEPLRRRALHVIGENARVEEAATALSEGNLEELGRLLDASHASLRDLYEVSTRAVEATVMRLRDAGALGARVIGGGFGGHVLALMPPGADHPRGARVVRPGAGAHVSS